MSIYVVSDLHSCYQKFIRSIPSDTKKLIILGDLFNKGISQEEMFAWVMKNRKNPRYVFVRGNAELRLNNGIVQKYLSQKTNLYFDYFGQHEGYKNKNIVNVVSALIDEGKYELDDVMDLLQNDFKWYHLEDNWMMAHAGWEFNKLPHQQRDLVLAYDTHNMLTSLKKISYEPKMHKAYKNMKFIFGHTPVYHIKAGAKPPVIIKDKFFFIDNGIFKTANPMFYMKIK